MVINIKKQSKIQLLPQRTIEFEPHFRIILHQKSIMKGLRSSYFVCVVSSKKT